MNIHSPISTAASFAFALAIWFQSGASAAPLEEARVTQVVRDVRVLPSDAAPRPAAVNDNVRGDTAVRTGVESRSELTFTDQTLTRLGAQTIFSFKQGTRTFNLGSGAILISVPKKAGGGQIKTAAVTASITGTTVVMESHPDRYEFRVLEGDARLCGNQLAPNGSGFKSAVESDRPGDCVIVHAGQVVIGKPGEPVPDPVNFDVTLWLATNALVTGFPSLPLDVLLALQGQNPSPGHGIGAINPASFTPEEPVISPEQ
jgi:hypothetical protein